MNQAHLEKWDQQVPVASKAPQVPKESQFRALWDHQVLKERKETLEVLACRAFLVCRELQAEMVFKVQRG